MRFQSIKKYDNPADPRQLLQEVEIAVNGNLMEGFQMRLGDSGEAYFLEELSPSQQMEVHLRHEQVTDENLSVQKKTSDVSSNFPVLVSQFQQEMKYRIPLHFTGRWTFRQTGDRSQEICLLQDNPGTS